jgi:uncharacterized protein (DUF1800 family)
MWGKRDSLRHVSASLILLLVLSMAGCSGLTSSQGTGDPPPPPPPAVTAVSVSPTTVSVRVGSPTTFTATVTNNTNTAVTWSVNGTANGNSTVGTINSTGVYTPPTTLPSPPSVTITATSSADATRSASATVNLQNPIPTVSSVSPALIQAGAFTITVNGTRFVQGAQVMFAGQMLATTWVSSSQLTASGTATASQVGSINVAVINPDPGTVSSTNWVVTVLNSAPKVTYNAAVRFLEQSTFGPTQQSIAHVQAVGFDTFLAEQFAAPVSAYPFDLNTATDRSIQNQFYVNAVTGQNQLRLRMSFALQQIMVVSGLKITQDGTTPSMNGLAVWQQIMEQDAFGTYANLLKDVTLSPVMGHYLDMVNNDKPATGRNPNENYAREILQLFSIGVFQLNPDGTVKVDAQNQPINTYDEDVIEGYAHLFTGWTYPLKPGGTQQKHNPQYYGGGPMVVVETNHYTGTKQILDGVVVPAGQTSSQDLDQGLAAIANHSNVGPFICTQLIRHLVKSNPSPAYIQRVTDVFANNGNGVRGDLQAVAKAILLDAEARAGDDGSPATVDAGHLREPALYISGILRALNASTDGARPVTYGSGMDQSILYPGSVFNYFHPDYQVPGTTFLGPEFEILGPAAAIARANFVGDLVFSTVTGTLVDFSSWTTLAADPNKMLDAMNDLFLHGQMSAAMRTSILTAVNAVPTTQPSTRAKQALYLVLTSPQYQVQQ